MNHSFLRKTVSNSKLRVHFMENSMFSRRVNMRWNAGLNCNWYKTLLSWTIVGLSVAAGCGTGDYEKRLDKCLHDLQAGSKFNGLYGPQLLAETPISLRVPKMFLDPPLVEGAMVNGKPIDPRRVKPFQGPLPGLKLTYEGFVESADGLKTPYHCYLLAMKKVPGPMGDPVASLPMLLNTVPHDSLSGWSDIQGETPSGGAIPWKKIRMTGNQEFVNLNKAGEERFVQMPGLLDIYVHEEAGFVVMIVWRMPNDLEAKIELGKWAPMVAGSITAQQ